MENKVKATIQFFITRNNGATVNPYTKELWDRNEEKLKAQGYRKLTDSEVKSYYENQKGFKAEVKKDNSKSVAKDTAKIKE